MSIDPPFEELPPSRPRDPWLEPELLRKSGFKRVFDPDAARFAATRLQSEDPFDAQRGGALAWLQKMSADEYSGYRAPLRPDLAVAAKIEAIGAIAPNFQTLVDLVVTRIRASLHTRSPFQPPPLLLVGPPGVGKTYVASGIAKSLGSLFYTVSMVNETSVNPFAGTDRVWRGARIGTVARLLIEGSNPTPLILIDELDKPLRVGNQDSPIDPLHALLEPLQAATFHDNLLDVDVCADAVFWLASANTLESVPATIVDRFPVLHIDPPTTTQMRAVVQSIYIGVVARYPGWFDAELSDAVANRLISVHPRAARRLLDESCARAGAAGRRHLTVEDVDAAISVHSAVEQSRRRIGFT